MNCTICKIYYQFLVHNFSSGTLYQICTHAYQGKLCNFQITILNEDSECVHEDCM